MQIGNHYPSACPDQLDDDAAPDPLGTTCDKSCAILEPTHGHTPSSAVCQPGVVVRITVDQATIDDQLRTCHMV